ncbi:MAG: beta-galactosidase [Candidatus Pacebacteria bacterium]|nr:beta-galactosidase [Candidatus Paceibacterota bacterium]MBP9842382.1 beta-galactosidase [Candidatus Paceibacterota bacterium]
MFIAFRARFLKSALWALFGGALIIVPLFLWIHISKADSEEMTWGVNFSESQAEYLGLDAKETYFATIHDLGVKHIKIHTNWNAVEPENNTYNFSSLDYQVKEAEANDVKLILVIGMKTGRWPECHTPPWVFDIEETERQAEILEYVRTVTNRYKHSKAVEYWQIENEPFLEFGDCPDWYYELNTSLIKAEVNLVKQLDPSRKIIISESGELSDWTTAAEHADIVGVTMYRSTWNGAEETFGVNPYSFLAPQFYYAKASYIKQVYKKPVISIELQAEPWTAKPLRESKLEIQEQSMNPDLFKENVLFAKEAGLGTYYFWGVEWWYWMNTVHNKPEIWNLAKEIFATNE